MVLRQRDFALSRDLPQHCGQRSLSTDVLAVAVIKPPPALLLAVDDDAAGHLAAVFTVQRDRALRLAHHIVCCPRNGLSAGKILDHHTVALTVFF